MPGIAALPDHPDAHVGGVDAHRGAALSPTSRWASSTDLIYVPMPPFHSKSTGAQDGADQLRRCQRPHRVGESRASRNARRAAAKTGTDLAVRSHTPQPALMRAAS